MELSTIVTDALSIVTAMGTAFTSLSTTFGIFLFLPALLVITKSLIGLVKGILFFRRGKGRKG